MFKIKIISLFALIAKFRYKYCDSSISYVLCNIKALTYCSLKIFHEEMGSRESKKYIPKHGGSGYFLLPLYSSNTLITLKVNVNVYSNLNKLKFT